VARRQAGPDAADRRRGDDEPNLDQSQGGLMSWLGNIGGRLYRGEVSIDFVGRKKLWYIISGCILVISIAALLFRGLNYSVDFKGGSTFEFAANGTNTTQVANVVANAGVPNAQVQALRPVGSSVVKYQVQTAKVSYNTSSDVQKALASQFHLRDSQVATSFIGPSWGGQISQKAVEALIAFMIVIVAYLSIAFEWRMAAAAFVALAHDILITIGVYALIGFQVSPASVIGLLTILGYSLYDTVVVFDKVRENTAPILGTRRSTYSQAANLALNQTLVRSINTSVIALLPVTAILIVGSNLLGNGELKDLALVLFVGMLSGTYSSIFIATPVLADLKEREPQYKQLARQVALKAAGGRAAARKAKSAASGGRGTGNGTPNGASTASATDDSTEPGQVASATAASAVTDPADDAEDFDTPADDLDEETVTAGAGSQPARGASSVRPVGPRQQPRRTSAAKRRPSGKKKRR
jgi:preprotein translocase subunit SecF